MEEVVEKISCLDGGSFQVVCWVEAQPHWLRRYCVASAAGLL